MLRKRPRQLCLLLLAAVFGIGAQVAAEELDENRRALQQIQEQIRQAATRLEGEGARERSLVQDLRAVETTQLQLQRRLEALSTRLTALDADLAKSQRESETLSSELVSLEAMVRQRLGVLYRQGNVSPLRFLLGGESPLRLAQDDYFLERIILRDRQLLQGYQAQLATRRATLERLQTLREQERQLLERREQERAVLAEAVRVKETLLGQVRRDRSALATQLDELQQRAVELTSLIKRLESARSASYSQKNQLFPEQKGRLPWPAAGRIRVGFGVSRHPELGSLFQSQGLEIQVAASQPVVAVWPGKVVFAERFKGYGQLLILEHGGYYTLYAQLARLTRRVGDSVAQGEALALPGGADGDRLYFEIRKGGVPLDPIEWLTPR